MTDEADKLFHLAKEYFKDLLPAEEQALTTLCRNVFDAKFADYSSKDKSNNDPAQSANWPATRTLKAEWLVWLCTNPQAVALVSLKGLNVRGARVIGNLDLGFAKILFPLVFNRCALEKIYLYEAEARVLNFTGSHTQAIHAGAVKASSIFLNNGFRSEGEITLIGAVIDGDLECSGGEFRNPDKQAFCADGIKVDGSIYLRNGFKCIGEVRLPHARIGGSLDFKNSQFSNLGKIALLADQIKVGCGVFLRTCKVEGEIRFPNASIGGDFDCSDGHFINADKHSLSAFGIKVEANVFLRNLKSSGIVDFIGASIRGNLECNGAQMSNPDNVALNADGIKVGLGMFLQSGFKSDGAVRFCGANIGINVECDGGQFNNSGKQAFNAEGIIVGGRFFMRNGFKAEGEVRFDNASIGGSLECDGGQFNNPGKKALNAHGIKVGNNVHLRDGFRSVGEVWLLSASIGNSLTCDGGQFINPGKASLITDGVRVGGGVFFRKGFKSEGGVSLIGAHIINDFDCADGQFSNPGSFAIKADGIKIEGSIFLRNGFKAEGIVSLPAASINNLFILSGLKSPETVTLDLRHAEIGTLLDDSQSWPKSGNLFLEGFVYSKIDAQSPIDAKSRLDWLHRQPTKQFLPQPYEQLGETLRKAGHEETATEVLIAKNRDETRRLRKVSFFKWFWHCLFDWFAGYGYRPRKAFYWSLGFIISGTIFFHLGYSTGLITPTKTEAYESKNTTVISTNYPVFNAFVYSAETFVPLVKFYVADSYLPNANLGQQITIRVSTRLQIMTIKTGSLLRYYLWIHTAFGWVLTTLWVGGLTGVLRR